MKTFKVGDKVRSLRADYKGLTGIIVKVGNAERNLPYKVEFQDPGRQPDRFIGAKWPENLALVKPAQPTKTFGVFYWRKRKPTVTQLNDYNAVYAPFETKIRGYVRCQLVKATDLSDALSKAKLRKGEYGVMNSHEVL